MLTFPTETAEQSPAFVCHRSAKFHREIPTSSSISFSYYVKQFICYLNQRIFAESEVRNNETMMRLERNSPTSVCNYTVILFALITFMISMASGTSVTDLDNSELNQLPLNQQSHYEAPR